MKLFLFPSHFYDAATATRYHPGYEPSSSKLSTAYDLCSYSGISCNPLFIQRQRVRVVTLYVACTIYVYVVDVALLGMKRGERPSATQTAVYIGIDSRRGLHPACALRPFLFCFRNEPPGRIYEAENDEGCGAGGPQTPRYLLFRGEHRIPSETG